MIWDVCFSGKKTMPLRIKKDTHVFKNLSINYQQAYHHFEISFSCDMHS